jgi:uroporphyrinogen decarboxylase
MTTALADSLKLDKASINDSLFLRAARGESVERVPCWLMRQAGRYDPEYQRIRRECGLELEDLFREPTLAAQITILPARLGVDALILFQDILTLLGPMGAPFIFRPGPQLAHPVSGLKDVEGLRELDAERDLPYVPRSIKNVLAGYPGLPLIGFAGAPWTLAAFLIEGQSPHKEGGKKTLAFAQKQPQVIHQLLGKLTRATIAYLQMQIRAGVHAIQLFESAADLVDEQGYATFALPYQKLIFASLPTGVPKIIFAKDHKNAEQLAASGADILSLSHRISLANVRKQLGPKTILQGNIDNRILHTGTPQQVRQAVVECLRQGQGGPHILNLGHGILEGTPLENVQALLDKARRT